MINEIQETDVLMQANAEGFSEFTPTDNTLVFGQSDEGSNTDIGWARLINIVDYLKNTFATTAVVDTKADAAQVTELLSNKVDKVDGKVLSSNDFTNELLQKLNSLSNYTLPTASDTTLGGVKVGGGLVITNGVLSATGGGVADSVDWENVVGKPSTFTPSKHTHTKSEITDFPNIPTKTSDLTNDSNFVNTTTMNNALDDKVDKVSGKGLSTNDYTTTEKTKLAGLSNYTLPTATASTLGGVKVGAGLTINNGVLSATGGGTADSVDWSNIQNKPSSFKPSAHTHTKSDITDFPEIPTKTSDLTNDSNFVNTTTLNSELSDKVDKVDGKGLSTNDYTTTEKTKLAGLSNYTLPAASTTTLGGVKVGSGLSIDGNGVLTATGGGGSGDVPDTTITDIRPTTMTSGTAFSYDASANRTYKQLILSGSLAAAITFTISTDSGKTNEHYLLVTNKNSSTASVAVTVGSWNNLIGMSSPVEISAGKSVEFSFKVYNSGSSTYLVVTHSEEL